MSIKSEHVDVIAAAFALEGDRIAATIAAGLQETNKGLRMEGAGYRPLPTYANQPAYNGSARVLGWSVRAAAAGPVTVTLHDGHDAAADVFAAFTVAASDDDTQWFGPGGIAVTDGLFIEVTGTIDRGSVFLTRGGLG